MTRVTLMGWVIGGLRQATISGGGMASLDRRRASAIELIEANILNMYNNQPAELV
jgi:hypothetical protein